MSTSQRLAFGEVLRRYRLTAGLTQELLAQRAGLSARGVQDLERGVRQAPYAETVRRLAEALCLAETDRATLEAAGRRLADSDSAVAAGAATEPDPIDEDMAIVVATISNGHKENQ
jgi:transcriptional regulator with XRE-family HTH domain